MKMRIEMEEKKKKKRDWKKNTNKKRLIYKINESKKKFK